MKYTIILAICLMIFSGLAAAQDFPGLDKVKWLGDTPEKGNIQIVEFWATWCPPCRKSIPHLNELHKKYGQKGLTIIGLSNEKEEAVAKFRKTTPMNYFVGLDKDGLGDRLGVRGIPTAFFVYGDKILWRGHPRQIQDTLIEKMLTIPKAPDFPALNNITWISNAPEKSNVQLVEFWATGCLPCHKVVPHLNKLCKKYGNRMVIVSLSNEKKSTVQKFQKKISMDYVVGLYQEGLFDKLEIKKIPTAFLVNSGKIVWRGHPKNVNEKMLKEYGIKRIPIIQDYEVLINKQYYSLKKITKILTTVKNEQSAKSAVAQITAELTKLESIQTKFEYLETPTKKIEESLNKKFDKKYEKLSKKQSKEVERIMKVPTLNKHLKDVLEKLQ